MIPEQFYFWLRGFVEASPSQPNPEQWQAIMNRLAEVKIFTPMSPNSPCGGCGDKKA